MKRWLNWRTGVGLLLATYLFWVVAPMAWVLTSSFKTETDLRLAPFAWRGPGGWSLEHYATAWSKAQLADYLTRSVAVTTVSVVLIVGLGAMIAFALGRYAARWSGPVAALFLAGLTLPAQLTAVPLFFELKAFGLLGSLPGLVLVYVANGLPFAVFILTPIFRALPASLQEAALLDGCSPARLFFQVLLPLARPGLVTVAIFQFIGIWKEYFFAFLFVSMNPEARTLPLGLANLAITAQYQNQQGPLLAGVVLVTLPLLAIYLLLQRQLVAGITAGAVKG